MRETNKKDIEFSSQFDSLSDMRETRNKYGVSQIPLHIHNGTDAPRIFEYNLIKNNKNLTGLSISNTSGGDETTNFVITGLPNLSRITFAGYARNAAGGGTVTERAVINGYAELGRCYVFSGTGFPILSQTDIQGQPIIQMTNSMYTSVSGSGMTLAVDNRVSVSAIEIANAASASGTVVSLTVNSYQNNSVEFTSVIDSGWLLTGNLIFS